MALRKISDRELSEIFRSSTRAGAGRAGCPDPETFHRAATHRLLAQERDRLVEHLGSCSTCVEEYRALRALEPWREELQRTVGSDRFAEPVARSKAWLAAAAMVIVILGLVGWGGFLLLRNRELTVDLAQARDARVATPPATTTVAESLRTQIDELQQTIARLAAPQIDVLVVDLDLDDQVRGAADTEMAVVSVPRGGTSFTVILTLPEQTHGDLTVELKKGNESVWNDVWRRARDEQSVAITLTRVALPSGTYRFEIRRRPGDAPLAVYRMRVTYE